MLRSQTVNTIHDLHAQEKSVQEIAQELGFRGRRCANISSTRRR